MNNLRQELRLQAQDVEGPTLVGLDNGDEESTMIENDESEHNGVSQPSHQNHSSCGRVGGDDDVNGGDHDAIRGLPLLPHQEAQQRLINLHCLRPRASPNLPIS